MAATRRQHKNQKESAWVPPLQRDPGPWNRLLLNWLATLAIIMVFGLVMLYSASYTTGYLRMGDSLHYIKQQAICMAIGIGCMVVMSYVDHRFLRWASKPLYWVVLAMLAVTLTFAPLNGCRRWIRLGGLTLQTSEVAKFEMILLSSHLAASAPQIGRFSPSLREKIKPKDWLFIRIVRQLIVPVLFDELQNAKRPGKTRPSSQPHQPPVHPGSAVRKQNLRQRAGCLRSSCRNGGPVRCHR